jgi:hypothetical protein
MKINEFLEEKIPTLNEDNYQELLDNHFKKGDIVFCAIVTGTNCASCQRNSENIKKINEQYPNNNVIFYHVRYTETDILQNYPEINKMRLYPKIIIFYGSWNKRKFVNGILTAEQLEKLMIQPQETEDL